MRAGGPECSWGAPCECIWMSCCLSLRLLKKIAKAHNADIVTVGDLLMVALRRCHHSLREGEDATISPKSPSAPGRQWAQSSLR